MVSTAVFDMIQEGLFHVLFIIMQYLCEYSIASCLHAWLYQLTFVDIKLYYKIKKIVCLIRENCLHVEKRSTSSVNSSPVILSFPMPEKNRVFFRMSLVPVWTKSS